MSDDGPSEQELQAFLSNAGRCDVCGSPIDMRDSGDVLAIREFTVEDEHKAEHGVTDQGFADAAAEALERVGETGADYDLAQTIREDLGYVAHQSCIEETSISKLETPADELEEIDDE